MKTPQPRVSVFCRCGAQWYGRHAVGNPVIVSHRARCGRMLTEQQYRALGHTVKRPAWWKP